MKFLDNLNAWRLRHARNLLLKSNPAGIFAVPVGQEGRALSHPSDPDAILRAGSLEVWAFVAINTIGKSLSEAPLIVEQRKTVNAASQWMPSLEGKLYELIQHPNKRDSFDILLWRMIMSLMTGDAYLIYDKVDNELYHIYAPLVRPVVSKGEISGYRVARSGRERQFEIDEIIHLSLPNPQHEFFGMSPLQSVQQEILIRHHYKYHVKNFFKYGAVPTGAIETTALNPSDEDYNRWRQQWQSIYGGQQQQMGFLPQGWKYVDISPPLGEMINDTLNRITREAVIAAFGVPPVLGGIFEYANFANSKEQLRIFWENCILPLQRIISGMFNIQLVPRFGDNVRLRFDVSRIPALKEDEDAKNRRILSRWTTRLITRNQALTELGYEQLDDESGEEYYARPEQGLLNFNSGESATAGMPPNAVIKVGSSAKNIAYLTIQKAHKISIFRYENQFATLVRRYFDGQLDRILKRLKGITFEGRFIPSLLWAKLYDLTKAESDDTADHIFTFEEENKLLKETIEPFLVDATRKSGDKALRDANIDLTFNLNDPNVKLRLAAAQNRIIQINDTTYEEIVKVLQGVYDEGVGINEAERRLRDLYSGFSKARAKRIAMTEMNTAVNGARQQAYEQAEQETGLVMKKAWLSAFLDTSRPEHIAADVSNYGTVGLKEKFIVGGEPMEFPGDPAGSPSNVINCHCTMSTEIE